MAFRTYIISVDVPRSSEVIWCLVAYPDVCTANVPGNDISNVKCFHYNFQVHASTTMRCLLGMIVTVAGRETPHAGFVKWDRKWIKCRSDGDAFTLSVNLNGEIFTQLRHGSSNCCWLAIIANPINHQRVKIFNPLTHSAGDINYAITSRNETIISWFIPSGETHRKKKTHQQRHRERNQNDSNVLSYEPFSEYDMPFKITYISSGASQGISCRRHRRLWDSNIE